MRGPGPPGSKPMLSPLYQVPGRLNGGWFQLTQVTASEKTAVLEVHQKPTTYTSSFLVGSVQILQRGKAASRGVIPKGKGTCEWPLTASESVQGALRPLAGGRPVLPAPLQSRELSLSHRTAPATPEKLGRQPSSPSHLCPGGP